MPDEFQFIVRREPGIDEAKQQQQQHRAAEVAQEGRQAKEGEGPGMRHDLVSLQVTVRSAGLRSTPIEVTTCRLSGISSTEISTYSARSLSSIRRRYSIA